MKAACLIRSLPNYRRDAFVAGLEAVGCRVNEAPTDRPTPDDLLVIWNRYGTGERYAEIYERAGARVLVAENGYVDPSADAGGPRQWYALALDHHNGAGRWFPPDGEEFSVRWPLVAQPLDGWRQDGDHVLLLPQRGIGPTGVGMPSEWVADTLKALKRYTDRPIRVRPHPGARAPATALRDDLAGAWCAVTWGSGAALKALIAGVPVACTFDRWIGRGAASFGPETVEAPVRGGRRATLERLAWAQWHVDEIARGDPFRHLLFRRG